MEVRRREFLAAVTGLPLLSGGTHIAEDEGEEVEAMSAWFDDDDVIESTDRARQRMMDVIQHGIG